MKRFRLYLNNEYIGVIYADEITVETSLKSTRLVEKFILSRGSKLAAILWADSNVVIEQEGVKYNEPNVLAAS